MPFRLKEAPSTFQRRMSIVFKQLKENSVVSTYLDDIIIPSKDWNHMMTGLVQVFEELRGANLTLSPQNARSKHENWTTSGFVYLRD